MKRTSHPAPPSAPAARRTGKPAPEAEPSQPAARSVPGDATYDVSTVIKASVVELTAEAIRTEIKMGRLAPGQRLIESEIGATLGASRASVREALGRLEADGLIEMVHQKGARVRRMTITDAQNIYQIREMLEGLAARLAARNIGKGDNRKRLKALQKSFRTEVDGTPNSYLRYNEQFHRLIVDCSENVRLYRMIEQLHHAAFVILVQLYSSPRGARATHDEHAPIVNAILAGDEDAAEQAMRAHIRRTGDELVGRVTGYLG